MSRETMAWAAQQRCGGFLRKAILMELANWAAPDGMVKYRPIDAIAETCECDPRTVKRHLKQLEERQLIRKIARYNNEGGQKPNGFELIGYGQPALDLDADDEVTLGGGDRLSPPDDKTPSPGVTDCHGEGDSSVTGGVTGVSPNKESNTNPPLSPKGDTPPTQEIDDEEKGESSTNRATQAENWSAPPVSALSDKAGSLVEQWPPGAYEAMCENFRLHRVAEDRPMGRKQAWIAALSKWLISDHAKVMRDKKAGVSFASLKPHGSSPSVETREMPVIAAGDEDDRTSAIKAGLRKSIGSQIYNQWLESVAMSVSESGDLLIVAPSNFAANWIEQQYAERLEAQAKIHIGETFTGLRFGIKPSNKEKTT